MSYRTYIEGVQIFGNNESYKEWTDFIRANGIEIKNDGEYCGFIKDVQGMFSVIDKIAKRLMKERHEAVVNGVSGRELTDFSDSIYLDDNTPTLFFNMQILKDAYVFMPYQAYLAVQHKLERCPSYEKDGVDWAFCSFKLKDGLAVLVEAY